MTKQIYVAVLKGSIRNKQRQLALDIALPCAGTLDATMHGRADVEPPLETPAEEVTRLRDALNELRDIMARPALWSAGEPPRIVSTSLDALFGIANEVDERVAQRTRELALANDALRESERNSRLVVDSIPGLVALLTAAGELEFVNHQILDYTGRTLEELKQWATSDTVHPEDHAHVAQVSSESFASGRSYDMVHRLRRSDGVYRWFQNNSFPLRDTSGHIVGWCVLLTDIEDRKRAEDALRESEQESRLIVDTIPGLVATLTPGGEIALVNKQVLAYCGRTLEELKQWGTSDTVHAEDLPRVTEIISQSMESGDPFEIEERIRRFDGVYRWFQVRGLPLRDSEGRIVRWYVLLSDIDERRRAEDALRASELNFQLTVDTIPGMVHTMTATGEIEFVNHQILDFLGKTLEELNNWAVLLHPDDRSRVVDQWRYSVATGDPFEAEHRVLCADGTYRWLQSRGLPLRDTSGSIVRWYNLLTDIDERKRAEETLRSSERDLKLIIDTIPALVWSARPDGGAEFFNRHYQDFAGLSEEEASDWGWTVAVHPEDINALTAAWQRIMASEAPGEAEARLRRHDGEYRWFLFRANPLRDAEGKIVNWYGINTDIEDRKRAEVDLRRAYDSFADGQRISRTGNFTADIVADDHIWSAELYRIFEIDPATKITVQAVRDIIHPEDLPSFDAGFRRSLDGADFDLVFRIITSSGNTKYVHSVARLIERVAGRPLFIGAIRDVTESKIAEKSLQNALEEITRLKDRLHDENLALKEEIAQASMFEEVVGASAALKAVLSRVSKVAPTDSTVLLTGETGTGKELIARAIHKRSRRSARAFISVNCAAIPASLIASELFGHEKGAFTGASARRVGRFELAEDGTIFLDEVGELPSEMQVTLLRVLQEGEFERVGGNQPIRANARVVAATNRDLDAAIATGAFRSDLFYRLNVFPIEVPPLRERKEDIPLLVDYFIARFARKAGKRIRGISKKTLDQLLSYPWPGNIRELQNVIERSVVVCETETFSVDESWLARQPRAPQPKPKPQLDLGQLAAKEKEMIEAALRESSGRVAGPSGAAAKLGIPASTLESKIKSLRISKNLFKP